MRVLVAGGAGFIGSHVCETLLRQAHEVICLDNLATGSLANIAPLEDYPTFSHIEGDVTEPPFVEADIILHLASPASPVYYRRKSFETMMANSIGTLRLLELAQATSARFIFTSTSEVYGDPLEHPQCETYWGNVNPVGERSCYDESKRFGETLVYEFVRRGVDASIVRIFNTYGPRMDPEDGRVIPSFIDAALTRKPFPIQGTGNQTRSFCFVTDLVDVLLRVAFRSGSPGEVFNIGNPYEVTVLEVAQVIAGLLDIVPQFEFFPAAADDPARRRPDISRARQHLGWQPATNLDEGLRQTIDYFSSQRKASVQ